MKRRMGEPGGSGGGRGMSSAASSPSLIPLGSLAVMNIDVEKIEDQKIHLCCVIQSRDQQTVYVKSSGKQVLRPQSLSWHLCPWSKRKGGGLPRTQSGAGLGFLAGGRVPPADTGEEGRAALGFFFFPLRVSCPCCTAGQGLGAGQLDANAQRARQAPAASASPLPFGSPFSCRCFPSAASGRGVVPLTVAMPSGEPTPACPARLDPPRHRPGGGGAPRGRAQ